MLSGTYLARIWIYGWSVICAAPVSACTIALPPLPPLRAVPAGAASTVRVRVQSIYRGNAYQAPIIATVQVLSVYRGKKPQWTRGKLTFYLPLCSAPSVAVEPGADLIVYGVRSIEQLGSINLWTSYDEARRFDRLVR